MKKFVLVVAMFMFVCGGSFLGKAQSTAKAATAQSVLNATYIRVTATKNTVTSRDGPAETAPVALAALNSNAAKPTASTDPSG
ncbi:hypothetical protein, secreted [gut metagenome]|uniref:Uncharacterized protein n=1 Tax=gut metagenome TaxID=749906 RepID=J9GU43_9ZZZZ